ncbi:MAG TPA: hypothetical protein VHT34_03795 [Clostridia bacterium]|nr:hypothetical protein [Clostridia bacterium]
MKIKLSKTSAMHYWKLMFRSILFITALLIYIVNKVNKRPTLFGRFEKDYFFLFIIWGIFVVEMCLRFFPSYIESMGCRKQFRKNYIPTGVGTPIIQTIKVTILIALGWIGINSIFGVLYLVGVVDWGIMLLLSLAYSVCDMICILFFCPFQTWFMKNKCCGNCRIYNWDYAMMFTPLAFVKGLYTWSILILAIGLVANWELLVARHPERFSEATNAALSCANCTEKLCSHKKQLQKFLKENRAMIMHSVNKE